MGGRRLRKYCHPQNLVPEFTGPPGNKVHTAERQRISNLPAMVSELSFFSDPQVMDSSPQQRLGY
jgi:hypothetical protein